MSANESHNFLNENQVAEKLNVSVATLQRWRWAKRGPAYAKFGRCVRYDESAVEAFINQSRVDIPFNNGSDGV